VSKHIDGGLHGWDYEPGTVQARLIQGADGRQVLQMRVELGILQLELEGRPDGRRPHAFDTYLAYLRDQARRAAKLGRTFQMSDEQCQEADREFVQYYHRRVCWLAQRQYARALADADHTLAFMDFVRTHSPSEEYTQAHEQYRGFVTFQRTQAAAALALEQHDPEGAVDAVRSGLEQLKAFFASFNLEEQMDDDGMVQHLRRIDQSLREQHGIGATLQEQLEQAIAKEEYETAARLRDALKKRSR
jgi:hypothetical protein